MKNNGDIFDIMAEKQGKTVSQLFADNPAPVKGVQEEKLPAPVYFPDPDATPEEIKEFIEGRNE